MADEVEGKGKGKGFASMSKKERSRIASMGGKAAHATGRAHRFTSEEAFKAGFKASVNSGHPWQEQEWSGSDL